jgi:TonB family protein
MRLTVCVVLILAAKLLCAATSPDVEEAVAPAYPVAAAEGRIAGTVIVEVRVSAAGSVENASVAEGQSLLRQASLEAARLWRFHARRKAFVVKLNFSYKLMPKGTPEAQLSAVFRPPYTVEVRKIPPEQVKHYARAG